jgi:hypothetical protein
MMRIDNDGIPRPEVVRSTGPSDARIPEPSAPGKTTIDRREAIRRAAIFAGVAFSPAWLSLVERRASAALLEQQAPAAAGQSQAQPRYLTPARFAIVAAVSDRILPRTDTPGAVDVGVPAFIDLLYGEFMTDAERQLLTSGLDAIDRAAVADGEPFQSSPVSRQDELLRVVARLEEDQQPPQQGPFRLIRSATILGYFTSEPVARTVLHYDPIPGRYDSCIPIDEVGRKNWTT